MNDTEGTLLLNVITKIPHKCLRIEDWDKDPIMSQISFTRTVRKGPKSEHNSIQLNFIY